MLVEETQEVDISKVHSLSKAFSLHEKHEMHETVSRGDVITILSKSISILHNNVDTIKESSKHFE